MFSGPAGPIFILWISAMLLAVFIPASLGLVAILEDLQYQKQRRK